MSTRWLVTGAAGFVGNHVVRALLARGDEVWAGVHRSLDPVSLAGLGCERVRLDVTDPASVRGALDRVVTGADAGDTIVIHAAGLVSIADQVEPLVWRTNVDGTRNVIEACREFGVRRLVYVGSVHAIPEPRSGPLTEQETYDQGAVDGGYARSKAEASRLVLAAGDLDRVIVQPTGIIGPGDPGDAPVTRLIRDLADNRLPVVIAGGYDFVDVRDVALGIIAAAERGANGRSYLLGAGHLSLVDIARLVSELTGSRIPRVLPAWVARAAVPFAGVVARARGTRPLITHHSVRIASGNTVVSSDRAASEFGFAPRSLTETIRNTVDWVREHPAGR